MADVRKVRSRCIEDYVRINDEAGGTFTFCDRCPLSNRPELFECQKTSDCLCPQGEVKPGCYSPDINAWRDRHGDLWVRGVGDQWVYKNDRLSARTLLALREQLGPLCPVFPGDSR